MKVKRKTRVESRKIDDERAAESWIEVFPYGVAYGGDRSRPLVLFKDETGRKVVPVWSSPVDAGIALFQNQFLSPAASPHALTWKILEPLGVALEMVRFSEVKGHHQYLDLVFSGHPKLSTIRQRADEALSFCLAAQTRFFCQEEFIMQSRVMEAHLVEQTKKLAGRNRGITSPPYMN